LIICAPKFEVRQPDCSDHLQSENRQMFGDPTVDVGSARRGSVRATLCVAKRKTAWRLSRKWLFSSDDQTAESAVREVFALR
jgi:hypothetical protein